MNSEQWINELFETIDSMDAEKFISFLDEDAVFKFGNAPAAVGKAQIKEAVGQFFGSIEGLSHTIKKTWSDEDSTVVQGEVTYTRKNNTQVTLPFMNLFEMTGSLVKHYQIFIDVAPLFAET